jgi:hypothetical protein
MVTPDFLCIGGHYKGEHLHHVLGPLSARAKSGESSNHEFTNQKCIVRGSFRWLGAME